MKSSLRFPVKVLAITAILLISISGILSAQKIAIIDAGSSGSRLYVYNINQKEQIFSTLYPTQGQEKNSKGIALSSVKNQQDSVNVFLETMTNKYNPTETIQLYILATAGMRKTDQKITDEIYKKILKQKDTLKSKKYDLIEAMTISGRYEGFYAWIAANYKNGKIKIEETDSKTKLNCIKDSVQEGILEVGGASMQIAFAPKSNNVIFREGLGYIYSKSYLDSGVDQIFIRHKEGDPFNEQLENVSEKFYGLGTPIKVLLDSIKNTHSSIQEYPQLFARTYPNHEDSMENFHPYMNAKYIAWLATSWDLNNKLKKPEKVSDWTEGAALDIIINNEEPEKFDYQNKN